MHRLADEYGMKIKVSNCDKNLFGEILLDVPLMLKEFMEFLYRFGSFGNITINFWPYNGNNDIETYCYRNIHGPFWDKYSNSDYIEKKLIKNIKTICYNNSNEALPLHVDFELELEH